MWDFILFLSVMGLLYYLVLGINSILKKNGKTSSHFTMVSIFFIVGIFSLIAFDNSNDERKYIDTPYLNFENIGNINEFEDIKFKDDDFKDIVKRSEDEFIRWTATVKNIEDDKRLYLQEEALPEIEVKLEKKIIEENSITKGDIVTIVFCNRKVQRNATKFTDRCHPIF